MKNKLTLVGMSAMAFLFIACGDGGDSSFKNGTVEIPLTVLCVTGDPTNNDITSYETLLSGDTIVKDDDNAQVVIYHDVTGVKKICLVDNNSSAHILR